MWRKKNNKLALCLKRAKHIIGQDSLDHSGETYGNGEHINPG